MDETVGAIVGISGKGENQIRSAEHIQLRPRSSSLSTSCDQLSSRNTPFVVLLLESTTPSLSGTSVHQVITKQHFFVIAIATRSWGTPNLTAVHQLPKCRREQGTAIHKFVFMLLNRLCVRRMPLTVFCHL